ncbi:hypothetical protein TNCV_3902031 [Trichonephila clavipes]|nr:hypothetical protein TNCV_3902031 [Trichonephila clavipes]
MTKNTGDYGLSKANRRTSLYMCFGTPHRGHCWIWDEVNVKDYWPQLLRVLIKLSNTFLVKKEKKKYAMVKHNNVEDPSCRVVKHVKSLEPQTIFHSCDVEVRRGVVRSERCHSRHLPMIQNYVAVAAGERYKY